MLATADALGYRANPFARGLKDQRSMTIGMLVPDLGNPLFPPIVRGIEDVLRERGYAMILASTDQDLEREETCSTCSASGASTGWCSRPRCARTRCSTHWSTPTYPSCW